MILPLYSNRVTRENLKLKWVSWVWSHPSPRSDTQSSSNSLRGLTIVSHRPKWPEQAASLPCLILPTFLIRCIRCETHSKYTHLWGLLIFKCESVFPNKNIWARREKLPLNDLAWSWNSENVMTQTSTDLQDHSHLCPAQAVSLGNITGTLISLSRYTCTTPAKGLPHSGCQAWLSSQATKRREKATVKHKVLLQVILSEHRATSLRSSTKH